MRKIVIAITALLAIAFVIFSLAEIENILDTLRRSNPLFLALALLVEILVLFNNTGTFWSLYRLVGLDERGRQIFQMTLAGNFVNVVAPSGGVGGIAVFLDSARQRGLSTGKVMVAGLLYVIYEYAALFTALAAGFFVLRQRGQLNAAELTGAGFMLAAALGVSLAMVIGYRSPVQLGQLLAWLARAANRLLHPLLRRDWLKAESAYILTAEMADGFATLRANHRGVLWPLFFTLNNKLLLALVLALSFLCLGVAPEPGTVVAGFSVAHLFFYASPTPSGVGFVDSILPVVLSGLSIPLAQAVLVTLVYRSVSFWFPLLVGVMAFRSLQKQALSSRT